MARSEADKQSGEQFHSQSRMTHAIQNLRRHIADLNSSEVGLTNNQRSILEGTAGFLEGSQTIGFVLRPTLERRLQAAAELTSGLQGVQVVIVVDNPERALAYKRTLKKGSVVTTDDCGKVSQADVAILDLEEPQEMPTLPAESQVIAFSDNPNVDSDSVESEVIHAKCVHHWIIEEPNGKMSEGQCIDCGGKKQFLNSQEDWLRDDEDESTVSSSWRTVGSFGGNRYTRIDN